ncbi:MAG: ArsR family transcriptional regulator [Nocardioides sp.]|jgi:DNA-binding transcriptional ArsR family regulator|nr:ArsR family transcriptional regulator [Nocardioides sp.]
MTSESGGRIHDPRVLRAVAHPVRNRILSELSATGTMRAADVARELEIPANQASFHLRQLAKYGLVEEAPEEARDKRDRVWKVADERGMRVNLAELEASPGGKAAVSVFVRTAIAKGYRMIEQAYSTEPVEGTMRMVSDHSLRLTKQEAGELAAELDELISAWGARTRGRSDERRTYQLFLALQPHPDSVADRRDDES